MITIMIGAENVIPLTKKLMKKKDINKNDDKDRNKNNCNDN